MTLSEEWSVLVSNKATYIHLYHRVKKTDSLILYSVYLFILQTTLTLIHIRLQIHTTPLSNFVSKFDFPSFNNSSDTESVFLTFHPKLCSDILRLQCETEAGVNV